MPRRPYVALDITGMHARIRRFRMDRVIMRYTFVNFAHTRDASVAVR